MTDLRVDDAVLEAAEQALARIDAELERSETYRDEMEQAWGRARGRPGDARGGR